MSTQQVKQILLLLVISFYGLKVSAQSDEERIKASMLFYLSGYIEWPASKKFDKFTIGLLGARNSFQSELNQISRSNRKIHEKSISVIQVNPTQIPKNINVLFVGPEHYKTAKPIYEFCKENAILFVTDELENKMYTVINFFYNKEKQAINFEVNKQNIILSKLNYIDEILIYGGNILDVKELYQSTQKLLQEEGLKVEGLSNELKDMSEQIAEKDSKIKQKNTEIEVLNSEIEQIDLTLEKMTDSISHLQTMMEHSLMEVRRNQENNTLLLNDYQNIDKQKRLQEKIISDNLDTLQKLDAEIEKRENVIKSQSMDLEKQNVKLKNKDKALYISLIFGLAAISLMFFSVYAYRIKNKYNKLLEKTVEERTSELLKSEQNYREIFNGVADSILIQDEQGKILAVNESMLSTFGYNEDELKDLNINILSDEKSGYTVERAEEMLQKAKINGQYEFDWLAKKKSGDAFWINVILRSAKIGGEELYLTVLRDIDDNKKNELELTKYRTRLEELVKEQTEDLEATNEELQSTNEELYEKNKIINLQNDELNKTLAYLKEAQAQLLQADKMASLGVLTAGVAHEINNPLNYIMGAFHGIELIHNEKSYQENEETLGRLLHSLHTGVLRAAEIVKGLNQFSRDSKSLEENCDLNVIMDNCLVMLNNKLKHHITIEKSYCPEDLTIKGNVGNIHQVFLNLLNNAENAIEGEGTINILTKRNSNDIIIKIKDSGEGIPAENLHRITDPFFTTKEPGKGTGLGLSIVYKIIQEHGGSMEFDSSSKLGTVVTLKFPLQTST